MRHFATTSSSACGTEELVWDGGSGAEESTRVQTAWIRFGVEGTLARQHFVEHAAQRKNVGARILRTAHDLFGAPVSRRAEKLTRAGVAMKNTRHAKVGELHATLAGDQNIGRLDVRHE